MGIYDDISRISVWPVSLGQNNGQGVGLPYIFDVQFVSSHEELFHQVYVNGRLSAVTSYLEQRRVWVHADHADPGTIRVAGVDDGDLWEDFSDDLTAIEQLCGPRVEVQWPRWRVFGPGSFARVFVDGFQVNRRDIPFWPEDVPTWGFGLGAFGSGDFGYDGLDCPGLGTEAFGYGEFGFDADLIGFVSEPMGDGSYEVQVKAYTSTGEAYLDAVTPITVEIFKLPYSASSFEVEDYEAAPKRATLSWTV